MTISAARLEPRAYDIATTDDELVVTLVDGRTLTVPLAWFPRLMHATRDSRTNWELLGDGQGIHWPDIDEDISVHGLLHGFRPLAGHAIEPVDGR